MKAAMGNAFDPRVRVIYYNFFQMLLFSLSKGLTIA